MFTIDYLRARCLSPVIFSLLVTSTLLLEMKPADAANLNDPALIAEGRRLFFKEAFGGNGRTCGTCHREERNFTIDAEFIATLPPTDPLFVAEFVPALRENFEKPALMRKFGLFVENLNGFNDLAHDFTMRSAQHTLGLRASINSTAGPRAGWSGDGAPNDGALRSFAIGAVTQHFPKTLGRVPGTDFRLPTEAELDALEAFQLSLGRQVELALPLPLKGQKALQGQALFLDGTKGKCNVCHLNAGANSGMDNNRNFNTGVEDLPNLAYKQAGITVPRDDGFGNPGDGTFNTPSLVESADTPPFFHNNAVLTIEDAVAFYNSETFAASPSGRFFAATDPNGVAIQLDGAETRAVAAFLRVINSLENMRQTDEHLQSGLKALRGNPNGARSYIKRALNELRDSINVLNAVGLHPKVVGYLRTARYCADGAIDGDRHDRRRCPGENDSRNMVQQAIALVQKARSELSN